MRCLATLNADATNGVSVSIPSPVLVEHDGIIVVRDDLIQGGTKRRVLPILFDDSAEYVYASPVCGYAQVALAHAAAAYGKSATIFCAARKSEHLRTQEVLSIGAKVVPVRPGYLSVVRARARAYCANTGAKLLPFGLDSPELISALAVIARSLPVHPSEVWSVAGSGVLSRALQLSWPSARVIAVRIGAMPDYGHAELLTAPERFEQDAVESPPFQSCANYDAKAWQFIKRMARPGALFWNVA